MKFPRTFKPEWAATITSGTVEPYQPHLLPVSYKHGFLLVFHKLDRNTNIDTFVKLDAKFLATSWAVARYSGV